MATNSKNDEREMSLLLQEIADNQNQFLENISCLKDTYEDSVRTLMDQKIDAEKQYNDLIKFFPVNEDGEMDIPVKYYREYQKKARHMKRTERASVLVPQSYLVSLISLYDQFFSGLVRLVYRIDPDKLKESNKTFTYRDLCEYQEVKEVRFEIIEDVVEKLGRDSHVKQFEWLAVAMGVGTLKGFKEWADFVELTERRNLFVHSDGVVSQQYINVCNSEKANINGVTKGSRLGVDKEYFVKAFKTLYVVGVKLTQMLAHTVYDKQYPNEYADMDKILIRNVYELIAEELYDVAISVSEFAHDDRYMANKHNANDKCYILLNYAQAYKWNGEPEKCQALLNKADSTIWKDELLIPKYALEENYDLVYEKMRAVGKGNRVLTLENYRQWPIFKEVRKKEEFAKVFKEIFDEELETNIQMKVETKEIVGGETETTSDSPESKGPIFFFLSDEKNGGDDSETQSD